MFTEGAVVAGIIAVNLPYMVLTLQSVIEGINRNVEEAAFSLGAGPATMFRRVLLPLSLPGILAGTILTFILGMNAYATPVLLGGPKFKMMGPLVYGQFQLNKLAVRRLRGVHPDDCDLGPDRGGQYPDPAPVPALIL